MKQLSKTQQRSMEWLRGGHTIVRRYGEVCYVNGGKVCTVPTMRALERLGLVKEVEPDNWKIARSALASGVEEK